VGSSGPHNVLSGQKGKLKVLEGEGIERNSMRSAKEKLGSDVGLKKNSKKMGEP